MTTRARVALIAAVVVIAVVGFIVLKPSDKKKTSSSATSGTPTQQSSGTKPSKPPVPQVIVKDGKPVGGVKTITVNKGDQVRFTVRSDVADEIHVHGYDFHKDVKAGGQVSFSFPAKIDGEFVIELESRGEQIISLMVNP
jgi:heme/copper-type cytochrome/quinol oxidase subunit 2